MPGQEGRGEPQFGGSGNGCQNNFYRTIITINKGVLPVANMFQNSRNTLYIARVQMCGIVWGRGGKEKWLFHSNGNRIEAFLFIRFVCFLQQLWQSFCRSQKAPLIAFQTNCPQKNVFLHYTKAKNLQVVLILNCVRFFI